MANQRRGSSAASSSTQAAAASRSAQEAAAPSDPKGAAPTDPKDPKSPAPTDPKSPAPIDPSSGSAAGGTPVEIHGRNLVGVEKVSFGIVDFDPTDITEINAGLLKVKSPAGVAGTTVDIVVVTRVASHTFSDAFTYE